MIKSISVFGIGKLGFPIVARFVSKGYRVIGYDLSPETIKAVNERKPNIQQPALLDCWRYFDYSEFSEKVQYTTIGYNKGSENE